MPLQCVNENDKQRNKILNKIYFTSNTKPGAMVQLFSKDV